MISITRKLEFDAGHRVLGHEGKCQHLHGHRYVAELTVSALGLDHLGRVIDFGKVKQIVGKWIDDNWDHNILLHPADPFLDIVLQNKEKNGGKEPFVLSSGNFNPTAENIAYELLRRSTEMLREEKIKVERVRIYETPNCWADAIA